MKDKILEHLPAAGVPVAYFASLSPSDLASYAGTAAGLCSVLWYAVKFYDRFFGSKATKAAAVASE